jgi:hypothetical protein
MLISQWFLNILEDLRIHLSILIHICLTKILQFNHATPKNFATVNLGS